MANEFLTNISQIQDVYANVFDQMIIKLGREVRVFYEPSVTAMPDAARDVVRNQSKLPSHKATQPTQTSPSETIKCLVSWNPKDAEVIGGSINREKTVVRLKTFMIHAPKLLAAKYIIVSPENQPLIDIKFRLLKPPVPRGLGKDRYIVTYWESIT